MSDKQQIVDMLRGQRLATCIDKKTFQIELKTPVTIKLEKDGIHTDSLRTIPYAEGISYLNGLLGIRERKKKWTPEEQRQKTSVLAKLYHNRVVKLKDTSFKLDDKKNPSIVYVSNTGTVRIVWARIDGGKEERSENVYEYNDCLKNLTTYGFSFVPNEEMSAQATMEEIEKNPHLMSRLLGPRQPQPPHISTEATRTARNAKEIIMSTDKQYWYHDVTKVVFTTKPGTDITLVKDTCEEIEKKQYKKMIKKGKATESNVVPDLPIPFPEEPKQKAKSKKGKKPSSPKAPRGKGLGVGGKSLSEKEKKAATKTISEVKQQGKQIRLLISDYDADNETIVELLELPDDKAVQRTRRAIKREANASEK